MKEKLILIFIYVLLFVSCGEEQKVDKNITKAEENKIKRLFVEEKKERTLKQLPPPKKITFEEETPELEEEMLESDFAMDKEEEAPPKSLEELADEESDELIEDEVVEPEENEENNQNLTPKSEEELADEASDNEELSSEKE